MNGYQDCNTGSSNVDHLKDQLSNGPIISSFSPNDIPLALTTTSATTLIPYECNTTCADLPESHPVAYPELPESINDSNEIDSNIISSATNELVLSQNDGGHQVHEIIGRLDAWDCTSKPDEAIQPNECLITSEHVDPSISLAESTIDNDLKGTGHSNDSNSNLNLFQTAKVSDTSVEQSGETFVPSEDTSDKSNKLNTDLNTTTTTSTVEFPVNPDERGASELNEKSELPANHSLDTIDHHIVEPIIDITESTDVGNDGIIKHSIFDVSQKPDNQSLPSTKIIEGRRRIVRHVCSDDESEQSNDERDQILNSVSPVSYHSEPEQPPIQKSTIQQLDECILNEKPGPKSKKLSTRLEKELKAQTLLQNAIVIPAGDFRKRKIRVLDSDDDGEISEFNVSDIGLQDNSTCEDVLLGEPDNILLNENDNNSVDAIEVGQIEKVIPIEYPAIIPSEDDPSNDSMDEKSNASVTTSEKSEEQINDSDNEDNDNDIEEDGNGSDHASADPNDPDSEQSISDDQDVRNESDHANNSDVLDNEEKGHSNDQLYVKRDSDEGGNDNNDDMTFTPTETVYCDPNLLGDSGIETISSNNLETHEHIIVQPDVNPFFSSISSTDDEFIPNDVYFGTPDALRVYKLLSSTSNKYKGSSKSRRRQEKATNTATRGKPRTIVQHSSRGRGGGRSGQPSQGKQSTNRRRTSSSSEESSSSSESDDDYKKTKRKPNITVKPFNMLSKPSLQVKRKKKSGLKYPSSGIPNEIYFGDVQVPLNVLYNYDTSNSSNDSSSSDDRRRPVMKMMKIKQKSKPISSTPSSQKTGRPSSKPALSPNGDMLIRKMKNYLKVAGIKRVKFNKLWEGCKSNNDRASRILELLHEKGLQGEPSIAKCKDLKERLQTQKEIEELDPNLIIPTEGRTRRSAGRSATHRNYKYEDANYTQERILKLKKVIDSDSD